MLTRARTRSNYFVCGNKPPAILKKRGWGKQRDCPAAAADSRLGLPRSVRCERLSSQSNSLPQ